MLEINNLFGRFGSFCLSDINLHVREGEHFVLLGPSGSGKSLLSECILGLRSYGEGEVRLAGIPVHGTPVSSVPVSYVPQDLAIFPHLNVRDNIIFGAVARKIPTEAMEVRLRKLSALLDIGGLLHRRSPATLSTGERQRVALARALIVKPRFLLLDEPFSAIDTLLKRQLAEMLMQTRELMPMTIFQVTHDQEEAFMLADRIGVLVQGRLRQVDRPSTLRREPASEEIARLLLARNIFDGQVVEKNEAAQTMVVRVGAVPLISRAVPGIDVNSKVSVIIRPEDVRLISPDRPLLEKSGRNLLRATVRSRLPQCSTCLIQVDVEGFPQSLEISVTRSAYDDLQPRPFNEVRVSLPAGAIWALSREGSPLPATEAPIQKGHH